MLVSDVRTLLLGNEESSRPAVASTELGPTTPYRAGDYQIWYKMYKSHIYATRLLCLLFNQLHRWAIRAPLKAQGSLPG